MPDCFGSNPDQLGSQRPQGPLLQCLGQCQPSEKIAEVVSQNKYPKKNCMINTFLFIRILNQLRVFVLRNPAFLLYGFRKVNMLELPANTGKKDIAKQLR